jgi:hypothetical protein
MEFREYGRIVAIEYAHFLTTQCFYNIKGYMMHDQIKLDDTRDDNEYQVDELYDYWFENIYLPTFKQ